MAGHTLEHPWGRQSSLKNISATRLGNGRQVLPSSVRLQYLKPHAAYSALTHGLSSKWSYLSRVTPNISHLLNPLDVALRAKLLPALTGRSTPNDQERALFALPAWLGGLGIRIPSKSAERELHLPYKLPPFLWQRFLNKTSNTGSYNYDIVDHQLHNKASIRRQNDEINSKEAEDLHSQLPP